MMKNILYSRLSRDRKNNFRIITTIIEENGEKYVLKTAGTRDSEKHIQSLKKNYDILSKMYGKSINIIPCTLLDNKTARFDFVEGETLTDRISRLYKVGDLETAVQLIKSVFDIMSSPLNDEKCDFKPDEKFKEMFGEFKYSKTLKGINPGAIDWQFNNIIVDEKDQLWLIDYEWVFEFTIPINFICYRCIHMLSFTGVISSEFASQLQVIFDIDDDQVPLYQNMEIGFLLYVRNKRQIDTLFDWHNKLGKKYVALNLTCENANNPKVFPDYGKSYSEDTKIVCTDFDFRYGVLNTRVVFPETPLRIRFDPVDGLYCLVSEIKVMADNSELPISWHNGSDLNGVLLFDTIDSNIYYENTTGANEFFITAKISAFNDESLLNALKTAQSQKTDFESLQIQAAETYNQCVQTQEQLASTQKQLDAVLERETAEKDRLLAELAHMKNCYDSISNSTCWKITYPLRKILNLINSLFKKSK